MKKLLSTLFALIMVMCLLPTIVFASGEMHIYGELGAEDSNSSSSGYYVTFDISVENADPFSIMYLNLDLPTGFTIVSVTTGESLAAFDEVSDFGGGTTYAYTTEFAATPYNNIKAKASNKEYTPEDGVILTVYILVDTDSVTNGTYPIEITQTSNQVGNIANLDAQAVPCTFTAGSIVVTNGQTATTEEESTTEFTDGYALEVQIDDGNYNVGDTITANIVAIADPDFDDADEVTFGSFQFTLDYDSDDLTLGTYTTDSTGSVSINTEDGKMAAASIEGGFTASEDGTTLATATFTVNNTITTGETEISLDDAYISVQSSGATNGEEGDVWTVTAGTADIYNLTVEFNEGTNTTGATGTTYVKYGESTLYTDNDYATPVTPSVTASTGYRLADDAELWLNDAVVEDYYTTDTAFTADASYTAQTVERYTVTVGAVTNGSWTTASKNATITVDAGDTLAGIIDQLGVTADTNYDLGSYYNDTTAISNETALTDGMIINATCVANSFDFTTPTVDNATITVESGLPEGKTTYDDDLVIEVAPSTGYVVTSVSYTVGEDEATSYNATTVSTGTTKTYTIDGENITGVINVTVTVQKYHTITFEDVEGAKLNGSDANVVLYALNNTLTLYASAADIGGTSTDIPTVTADEGYRIGGTSGTYSWVDVDESTLTTKLFTENTTYTAAVTKQYTVTFNNTYGFGSITGETTEITVDTGTDLTTLTFPEYSANTGYQFDSWSQTTGTITSDTTITASFKLGTYTITDSTGEVATYTAGEGIVEGYATYQTAANFTVVAEDGYQLNSVTATDADGNEVTLTDNGSGSYTIVGSLITSNITITVDTDSTAQLTFTLAPACTDMATGNAVVLTVLTYVDCENDGKLSTTQITSINAIEVTANAGYKFVGWYTTDSTTGETVELEDIVATADATYYAVFTDETYTVTAEGITGPETTATHGTDFTFTPSIEGSFVYGVYAQIGTGDKNQLSAESDGSYKITGADIIGGITITVDSFVGSISSISVETYKALENGTEILVLETTQLDNSQYTLNGQAFYWSSAYSAYVQIVDADFSTTSSAVLATQFAVTGTTAATEIDYTGNLDSSTTGVMAYDASIVNDLLYGYGTYEDKDRFAADVTGDKLVSTSDMKWILNEAVGISNDIVTD